MMIFSAKSSDQKCSTWALKMLMRALPLSPAPTRHLRDLDGGLLYEDVLNVDLDRLLVLYILEDIILKPFTSINLLKIVKSGLTCKFISVYQLRLE